MRWRFKKQETSVGSGDEFPGFHVPQEQILDLSGTSFRLGFVAIFQCNDISRTSIPVEAKIAFAELIDYTPLNLTMQEHKYDQFNAEQLESIVALLLAALSSLDEEGSYPCQEVTICIKWHKGGLLDIVLEDGSSQLNDVLQTNYVVTLDNMVRFVDDLKRIQSFCLDDQQDWAGSPMKLTVKYLLHQEGVNRYDCMLVAPVIADQFNDLSTTKSNATIPTTIHISVGNEEDSLMTEHDLMITPGGGNQRDELGTARSSVDADVSLESLQFSNKTAPNGQIMTLSGTLTAERVGGVSSFSHPIEHALVSTSQGVGASSRRQPVEIDENSIRTNLAGGRGAEDITAEEQETLLHPADSAGWSSADLLTQLLEAQEPPPVHRRRIWQTITGDPYSSRQSNRLAKHLVSISLCLVLIALGYHHGVMSLFFSSRAKASSGDRGGDAPKKDDRRARVVLDCAKILSNGRGLAEKDEHVTSQWQAVHWFSSAGIHIEVPGEEEEPCVWQSSFGRLYGLIVARETLGISDLSWHRTNPPLSGFEDVCHWKRITCDPSKQFVERLILNHADLTGSIPVELAYGLQQEQLVDLHMENNDLTGTIPSELGQLTQLETLFLHENAFLP
jgi:hypothetical protein